VLLSEVLLLHLLASCLGTDHYTLLHFQCIICVLLADLLAGGPSVRAASVAFGAGFGLGSAWQVCAKDVSGISARAAGPQPFKTTLVGAGPQLAHSWQQSTSVSFSAVCYHQFARRSVMVAVSPIELRGGFSSSSSSSPHSSYNTSHKCFAAQATLAARRNDKQHTFLTWVAVNFGVPTAALFGESPLLPLLLLSCLAPVGVFSV
jgi:hypothetical protein